MNKISQGVVSLPQLQLQQGEIKLQIFSEPCPPEIIINKLAIIEGPMDLYCWFEGIKGLPKVGAEFMKKYLFEPLYKLKKDVRLCLYSLKGWDFNKNVAKLPNSTALGERINRINNLSIQCFYASSFFRYCAQVPKVSPLYSFINEEIPKKRWLFTLSENRNKRKTTVAQFFNQQSSLFDCIKDLSVTLAYSAMQYVEGYYLIRESVENGLKNSQKKIEIVFFLPNDESKYYQDFPHDIKTLLRLDFGDRLAGISINISFFFFQYGDSMSERPYIGFNEPQVTIQDISSYFDYFAPNFFPRDVRHNINGWN